MPDFCNHRPRICLAVKFGAKIKSLNLGRNMPHLGTVLFEINNLEFI